MLRHSLNVIRVLAFSIVSVVQKGKREDGAMTLPQPPVSHLIIFGQLFNSMDDLILIPISVFDGTQQTQFLKFQNS